MRFSSAVPSFALFAATLLGPSLTAAAFSVDSKAAAGLQARDGIAYPSSSGTAVPSRRRKKKCSSTGALNVPTNGALAGTAPSSGVPVAPIATGTATGGYLGVNATSLSAVLPYSRTKSKCTKASTLTVVGSPSTSLVTAGALPTGQAGKIGDSPIPAAPQEPAPAGSSTQPSGPQAVAASNSTDTQPSGSPSAGVGNSPISAGSSVCAPPTTVTVTNQVTVTVTASPVAAATGSPVDGAIATSSAASPSLEAKSQCSKIKPSGVSTGILPTGTGGLLGNSTMYQRPKVKLI